MSSELRYSTFKTNVKYSVINTNVHNVDGIAKVTGRAQYTFDVTLPGMLYGKILRSPHPHAKIINIDYSKALELSGVVAVVTGKDTLGIKQGIWRWFCRYSGRTGRSGCRDRYRVEIFSDFFRIAKCM